MARRPYIGPSDAQANADALARRAAPYAVASDQSIRRSWDWHRREPADLREAVRMVRRAYADEVPTKLHEGPDSIGPDGTPKMTARYEGYIFGSAQGSDARKDPETGQWDAVSYFNSPFKAALANLLQGPESSRHHGRIINRVVVGGQEGVEAAIAEGVPPWCAYVVSEHVVRRFIRELSDLRIDVAKVPSVA